MTVAQAELDRDRALLNYRTIQNQFKTLTDLEWSIRLDEARTQVRIARRTLRTLRLNDR